MRPQSSQKRILLAPATNCNNHTELTTLPASGQRCQALHLQSLSIPAESLLLHCTLLQAILGLVTIQIMANQATPESSIWASVKISQEELSVLIRAQEPRKPDILQDAIQDQAQVYRVMAILLAARISGKGHRTIHLDNTQAPGRVMLADRILVERSNMQDSSILEVIIQQVSIGTTETACNSCYLRAYLGGCASKVY